MVRALAPRSSGRPTVVRRVAAVIALAVLASGFGPLGPGSAGAATFTFAAEADAHVEAARPNRNFGSRVKLEVDGSPVVESYLRFRVQGLDDVVRSARLRLYVSDSTVDGPAVYPSGTAWSESGITWSNRPARTGSALHDLGPLPSGTWAELDVRGVVAGNGTYSFNLAQSSSDAVAFHSRQHSKNRPQLVIETGSGGDTTPPETTIDSGPSGQVEDTSAVFTFSSNEAGATFQCQLDTSSFTTCTSPKTYSGLSLGERTFAVRAIDTAGNIDPTPASRVWTVIDVTAPDTTIDSGPSGDVASTSASFAFSSNEAGATFQCQLDTSSFTTCTSPKTYSGLSLGEHTFAVRATDTAGNVDPTPATRTWTVISGGGGGSPRDVLLGPATGAHWGAHHKVKNSAPAQDQQAAIETFEAAIGRTSGIDMWYEPWGNAFPNWREEWDFAGGRIPMISWGKTKTTDITSGKYDTYIRDRADGLKALGRPVFLRWFWEMDGTRNADIAVSPAAYIGAWRYLRGMFEERGVTNVAWVWCPNASGFEDGSAQPFYPGDEWVDWVCADGYNWYPSDGRAYQSFEEKFEVFHDWAVARGKPAMVGEYASQEMEEGRRAIWINEARESLKTRLTGIFAVVYFHSYSSDYDWQLTSEPDALAAYAAMGADPYFNP